MWCFSPKKILECFFIQKSCFVWLFLQWQCDSGIILTKVSTKVMFVFIWTNLPSFWVQMKNLVWHVVLSSQTSSMLFHWKILLFVVALTVTLWLWCHLDRNQHKVDVFNICLCCLSLGITWTNKFDTFLRFHESSKCCLAKKKHVLCVGFSSDSVFLHHSHWIQHHLGVCFYLVSVIMFSTQANKCDVLFSLQFI